MEWLVTSGIIALFFGLLLLFSKKVLLLLGSFFNKPVVFVDDLIKPMRVPAGIVLSLTGAWIIYSAFCCVELWFLHFIGVLVLFFGLLYLFLPHWLQWFSSVSDRLLFSTDVFVVGFRRGLGITLVVVAIYLFYSAYLI
ncbi:hypothetical protein ACFL37_02025 [Candidatus Margulisiibacteriota bacterium]